MAGSARWRAAGSGGRERRQRVDLAHSGHELELLRSFTAPDFDRILAKLP
jgi:hypothetical protein